MSENSPTDAQDSMLKIGVTACGILMLLIVFSGIRTRWIPAGAYDRVVTEGRMAVVAIAFGPL